MSESVPAGWKLKPLGELFEIKIGGTPSRNNPLYWDSNKTSENYWVSIKDLKGRFIVDTVEYLSDEGINNSNVKLIQKGTVMMSFKLTVGRLAIAGRNLYTNEAIASFLPIESDAVDRDYLYQGLQSWNLLEEIDQAVKGITLNKEKLFNITGIFPPLPEQQKIASILTSVDTVIEKTEAQINKLKDLKKAMMQELLTKGIGHTEFKDSPVGRIPVGWEVKSLGDISIVKRGASPRPIKDPKWWGGNTGWVRISNVTKSGKYLNETTNYLSEAGVNQSVRMNIGDVIMSICATIGRPIIVNTDVCIHDGFVWFDKLSDEVNKEYLYYLLSTKEEYLSQQRQTGTQGNLNTSIVSRLEIAIPPLQEQLKLLSIFNCLDSNVDEKRHKLQHTKSLKKALMQDLLTGKVRVAV